jgi:creatinine amidohydrolase
MRQKWAWAQRAWTQATNDTGSGDPQHATADKGARYLDHLAGRFAGYLVDLAQADPTALYERG